MKFGAVLVLLWSAGEVLAQGIGSMGGGGFGGPSILGRGGRSGQRQGDELSIRGFAGANAIYDSGLTSFVPGPNGSIFTRGAAGAEVFGGLYGTKQWRRQQFQISYNGDYRHYTNQSMWNGTDQSLGMSYSNLLRRRVMFEASVQAGTTNRAYGGYAQPSQSNAIFQPGLPVNSLFDLRTNYGNGNLGLSYGFTNRTSVTFSGGGYLVKRSNSALFGVNGTQARMDLSHRVNKTLTVGANYNFMTFQFSRAFGDTYIHGLNAYIGKQFGRHWELNLQAGVMRVETLGQRTVQIDPVIAAIIGVSVGNEVFYRKNFLPSAVFSLARTSRIGTLTLMASRSINPGNGIILTSQADNGTVSFQRRVSRKVNFDTGYTYSRLRGIGLIGGNLTTHNVGVGIGWQAARWTQFTARYDRRNSSTTAASQQANLYNLNGNRIAVGVVFTPSDLPVSLW